jgi:hypothetical protein
VLENAARDAQVKPRSAAEEFIVKIAKAVEAVMQKELLPLPQGTTIIPSEYTIFLSEADDKDWQGIKRRGLEQGLYHILAERAKEIAGKRKLETKSFVLELRVDGTLPTGDVRVQHSWEDSSADRTGVLSRPKSMQAAPNAGSALPETVQGISVPPPYQSPQRGGLSPYAEKAASGPLANGQPSGDQSDIEELTSVRPRLTELYKLEIWRNGIRQNVVPVYQNQIVIGRGSRSKPVDIALAGDPEISRRHITIQTDGQGKFWVTNEGRNAAAINNYDLPANQRVPFSAGVGVAVCSYMLRIQPR